MSNIRYYKGAIWTNHVFERLRERGISQEVAGEAFNSPDEKRKGKQEETFEFIKRIDNSTITLIAKQNEKNEWVILSSWIDPPLKETQDYKKREEYRKYQKSSSLSKFLYTIKKQLGI